MPASPQKISFHAPCRIAKEVARAVTCGHEFSTAREFGQHLLGLEAGGGRTGSRGARRPTRHQGKRLRLARRRDDTVVLSRGIDQRLREAAEHGTLQRRAPRATRRIISERISRPASRTLRKLSLSIPTCRATRVSAPTTISGRPSARTRRAARRRERPCMTRLRRPASPRQISSTSCVMILDTVTSAR